MSPRVGARWMVGLSIGLLCSLLVLPPSQPAADAVTGPRTAVGPSYFGLHMHWAAEKTAWPPVPFGTWRLWDAYVSWPFLEPNRGEWRFEKLDRYVAMAEQHGIELVLALGLSPAWASARPLEPSANRHHPGWAAEPRDLADWREYVRRVATRYQGRIRTYEIWNEPNLKRFFSGGVEEMLTLCREAYAILKSVDPSNRVVSPAATGGTTGPIWLEEFLRRGGADCADVIGYHFYVAPRRPEDMVPLIQRVQGILRRHGVDKPLWNTESGWMIDNASLPVQPTGGGLYSRVLSDREGAAYVARAHILNWAYGVQRLYWYAWDSRMMGMIEPDGQTLKQTARAYADVRTWLIGAQLSSCARDAADTWVCERRSPANTPSWVVWNATNQTAFRPPAGWRVGSVRPLLGEPKTLSPGHEIEVGSLPILLEPAIHQ